MADYRDKWDWELMKLSEKYFDKHIGSCSEQELQVLVDLLAAQKRLTKLDAFLAGFR